MKLNIANPATGAQKKIEIEDENKLRIFMERRMAEEVPGDSLGDEFKGYVFKITGGNDKDGFPMRQGVLVNHRVRLLLRRGMPCYYPKRKGERKRKAVRGCIVGPDITVLSLIIVKRGENEIAGLTDTEVARRLGPKRVDKIKKMFNLTKSDDVRDYIVRRKYKSATGKTRIKKPKIQRLITPTIKHRRKAMEKKLINRRRRSFQKRKEYFEKLAGTHKKVQEKKQKVVEKATTKKTTQKGPEKKQSQKKDSGKKDSQQPTQQTKPEAKKQQKKQPKKPNKPKQ